MRNGCEHVPSLPVSMFSNRGAVKLVQLPLKSEKKNVSMRANNSEQAGVPQTKSRVIPDKTQLLALQKAV